MARNSIAVGLDDSRGAEGGEVGTKESTIDLERAQEREGMEARRISSDCSMGFADLNGLETCETRSFSSPRPGSDHLNAAPVRSNSIGVSVKGPELTLPKSRIGKRETQKCELKLDNLTESERIKIIENLVKIKKDGTLKVDITRSKTVTAELLELDEDDSMAIDDENSVVEFNKAIPRLNIAILVVGTRGDVQPFIAFAKRLQEFGHHVRLATHITFCTFVKSAGVEFYPLAGDPRIMAGYVARSKGFLLSGPSEINMQRKQLKEIINSLLPACTEPDIDTGKPFKAQAIIANPPAYGHAHVAEALGIPLHIFFTMPWTPTNEFPHPFAQVPQSAAYKLSYLVVDLIVWWAIRGFINDFRKRKLNLPPIAYFSTYHGSISHLPTGYMWSPQLVPKPTDWGSLVDVVGFCFLNLGNKYQPQKEFVEWLQQGPKPIYIGFGSMPLEDEKKITTIILEALKETGQRGIISRGWGDLGSLSEVPVDVYLIEDCPHDWLFPRCSAVIHHGGAGTTATGLRAGCPTTIVPFFGDQFFWGDRVQAKGVGPAPIPISELNIEHLSSAISFMLEPEVKSRALALAKEIENEDGVAAAVDAFHKHLPSELPIVPSAEESVPQSPLQTLLLLLEKWCCLPFAS